MTDAELLEITRRAESASPGPWAVEASRDHFGWLNYAVNGGVDDGNRGANVALISHAREDVLALAAEILRLRERAALS